MMREEFVNQVKLFNKKTSSNNSMKTSATHKNKIIHNKEIQKTNCKHFDIHKTDNKRILVFQLSSEAAPLKELKTLKGIQLFHCADLTDLELVSVISAVDYVLIVVNENVDEKRLKFIKNFLNSNYAIVYENNENIKKSDVRKFIKGNFNKPNILPMDQLIPFLKRLKIFDNKISDKILPTSVNINTSLIEISAFCRKKLLSKIITINNLHKCEIVATSNDSVFQHVEIEKYLEKLKYKKTDEEKNELESSSASEEDSEQNVLENEPENFLIPKEIRENYKSINHFKNNSFETEDLPEIYENLYFQKQTIPIECFNKEIRFVLRPIDCSAEDIMKSNIFILTCNVYEQSDKTYFSIYNIYLNEIARSSLIILLSKFIKLDCLVTENNENLNDIEIRKLKDSGDSISFIAPLFDTSNIKNLKFFQCKNFSELKISDYLYSSKSISHHNICILQEHTIYGKILKIYEKYAKIRMFSCKEESKLFMKNKVYSKNNIGVITKNIGSKGLIKCLFERPVKYGETIKMFVYKRLLLSVCY